MGAAPSRVRGGEGTAARLVVRMRAGGPRVGAQSRQLPGTKVLHQGAGDVLSSSRVRGLTSPPLDGANHMERKAQLRMPPPLPTPNGLNANTHLTALAHPRIHPPAHCPAPSQ